MIPRPDLLEANSPKGLEVFQITCPFSPRCTCRKNTHVHPFLSPDGTMGFFNSDESGTLQAYVVRGFGQE